MPWFWQSEPTSPDFRPFSSSRDDAKSSTLNPNTASTSDGSAPNEPASPLTALLNPTTLTSTALLTTSVLLAIRFYKQRLRRIPTTSFLTPRHLAPAHRDLPPRSLLGHTTSVNDPDNLRFFHTPLGRLGLWGTFLRPIPTARKDLKDATLSVRIAGIDAPELPHFGKPGQAYGEEALVELRSLVEGRRVRIWPIRRDQYERVVAVVFVRRGVFGTGLGVGNGWVRGVMEEGLGAFWRLDVGAEMLRRGAAGVYEAKMGAEFGGKQREERYKVLQEEAKRKGLGMWQGLKGSKGGTLKSNGALARVWEWFGWKEAKQNTAFETPREFKQRMKKSDDESTKAKH